MPLSIVSFGRGLFDDGGNMIYTKRCLSPLGFITIACDDDAIIGLWFDKQKYFGDALPDAFEEKEHPLIKDAEKWLDIYFSGRIPDFTPELKYGKTEFQKQVCDIMLTIPYGKTMTYGQIASITARDRGVEKMSAQAVGGAVGHNPIAIIIPCHRVLGVNGSLTGYAGGIDRKIRLLTLENADFKSP